MSKNWTFQKIIGLGLNFTYEFEVCFTERTVCGMIIGKSNPIA